MIFSFLRPNYCYHFTERSQPCQWVFFQLFAFFSLLFFPGRSDWKIGGTVRLFTPLRLGGSLALPCSLLPFGFWRFRQPLRPQCRSKVHFRNFGEVLHSVYGNEFLGSLIHCRRCSLRQINPKLFLQCRQSGNELVPRQN